MVFEICDQYTLQVDAMSRAILDNREAPVSLEDAISNMVVIEKLEESNLSGKRVSLQ